MTDLEKAIAEIQRAKVEDTYTLETAEAWKEISEVVVSGTLTPTTEHDAAVAAALEAAENVNFPDDWRDARGLKEQKQFAEGFRACRYAIRALITQPAADALARVRAEAVTPALDRLKGTIDGPMSPFQRLTLADTLNVGFDPDDVRDFMRLVEGIWDLLAAQADRDGHKPGE